jgi:hypothetical protein
MTRAVELAQVASLGVSEAFKNRIINGGMVIDQRFAGAAMTFSQNPTYCIDRWATFIGNGTGGIVNTAQGVGVGLEGFRRALLITTTTGGTLSGNDYKLIGQVIEGSNYADLDYGTSSAKTATLSFWVFTSVAGNYTINLSNANAFNRNYSAVYNIPAVNTWTKITLTIPGDTTGTWVSDNSNGGLRILFSLGASGTVASSTITPGWGTTAPLWQTTGAANFLGTTGAIFYITGVQFEVGTQATSFEYRPYGTELALCQRYFCKSSSTNVVATNNSGLATGMFSSGVINTYGSNAAYGNWIKYPVTMRTEATTITFINTNLPSPGTSGQWSVYNGSAWLNTTSLNAQSSTTEGFNTVLAFSGTTFMYYGAWTSSAEL